MTDHPPECRITVSADGPYLVTGNVVVTDATGEPIETKATFALCRCGASGAKPLCDGSHAAAGWTADGSAS